MTVKTTTPQDRDVPNRLLICAWPDCDRTVFVHDGEFCPGHAACMPMADNEDTQPGPVIVPAPRRIRTPHSPLWLIDEDGIA